MKKNETIHANATTGVSVKTSVLFPGAAEQCAIREHGREQINLMLFGGGAAALFVIQVCVPSDPLAETLGRLLTGHGYRHSPPTPDLVRDIREQAVPVCEELAWTDLGVDVSPPRAAGKVTCYPLRCAEMVALVLATDDPEMPVTQIVSTTSELSRALLIAIGRTVIGHHGFLLQ